MKNKLILIAAAVLLVVVAAFALVTRQQQAAARVLVYKTPTCGCCTKWVDHLRAAGFEVETRDLSSLADIKAQYHITPQNASCHTGIVDGYVVEGHVPAEYVKRLLKERPEVVGITVPGMPIGSPGMEGDYVESYDVLTFDKSGNTAVFAHVAAP